VSEQFSRNWQKRPTATVPTGWRDGDFSTKSRRRRCRDTIYDPLNRQASDIARPFPGNITEGPAGSRGSHPPSCNMAETNKHSDESLNLRQPLANRRARTRNNKFDSRIDHYFSRVSALIRASYDNNPDAVNGSATSHQSGDWSSTSTFPKSPRSVYTVQPDNDREHQSGLRPEGLFPPDVSSERSPVRVLSKYRMRWRPEQPEFRPISGTRQ